MDRLTVRSRLGDYQVEFRDDTAWAAELCDLENAFFVVDELVWRLARRGLSGGAGVASAVSRVGHRGHQDPGRHRHAL